VAVSGLVLGSPWTKSYLNVGATGRHREYYTWEGGGFPWFRVVVNLVSLELLMACPSTKGALKIVLTNSLVGLVQV